jgi:membrane protease YdiL (CAAX protease family)
LFLGFSYSLAPSMPERETKIVMPPMWECLLASVGAGIREEVSLRLGVMTLFAWLGMVIARCRPGNSTAIWLGNVLSALVFGAIHLPQAAGLFGLNAGIVVFVLLGNGLPGVVFGWLFWRKGLIAAMASHFMFDIVLKVIAPALMG